MNIDIMDITPAISVRSLTRRFGNLEAVRGITFDVPRGSIFGFLGPNGAGKTTSMRMMTGMLAPTTGSIMISGLAMPEHRQALKSVIGVVPDHQNLYERLSARRHLELFAALTDTPDGRIGEVLSLLGLEGYADTPVQHLSRGWRQRVLIARGLLHRPAVFFLDEPTSALDPHSALSIRQAIRLLQQQGTTIFLTTHYMEEANSLCDRLAILNAGSIIAEGTPESIRMKYSQPVIDITLSPTDGEAESTLTLPLEGPESASQLSSLIEQGRVRRIHSREASLEEAFLRLTGSTWQPDPPSRDAQSANTAVTAPEEPA